MAGKRQITEKWRSSASKLRKKLNNRQKTEIFASLFT